MYKTEKFDAATFVPKKFESDHVITLGGKEIAYHTVCEDNVFYDNAGKAIATLFSYSYFNKTDTNPNRPVIFAYNASVFSFLQKLNCFIQVVFHL